MIRLFIVAARSAFRVIPVESVQAWVWEKCVTHLFWREEAIRVRAKWGGVFECAPIDFIQRYLLLFRVWEPALTDLIRARLRPGDVMVDIGANIGYFSILAARIVGGDGEIVAVEASPRICNLLERNLQLNKLQNVRVINMAVAEHSGVMTVEHGPEESLALTKASWRLSPRPNEITVHADRLMEVITPTQWSRARIIKIDIEGGEAAVLPDVIRNLPYLSPEAELVIELSANSLSAEGGAQIFEKFRQAGFYPYAVENSYSYWSYLKRGTSTPLLLDSPPTEQVDVLFSRTRYAWATLSSTTRQSSPC